MLHRGPERLWKKRCVTELATPDTFHTNPSLVWEFYSYRREIATNKVLCHFCIAGNFCEVFNWRFGEFNTCVSVTLSIQIAKFNFCLYPNESRFTKFNAHQVTLYIWYIMCQLTYEQVCNFHNAILFH